jgi:hypothetical protein
MASPPNPVAVPIVTYEYLFCLPSSERPSHSLDGRLVGYYRGLVPRVPWAASYGPTNLDTTLFPPAVNGWVTKNHVPHMVPPLLAEGEGPPT